MAIKPTKTRNFLFKTIIKDINLRLDANYDQTDKNIIYVRIR